MVGAASEAGSATKRSGSLSAAQGRTVVVFSSPQVPIASSSAGKLTIEWGDPALIEGPRIAVVSSWDSQPQMSRSLSTYLRELTACGYRVLVVSTAEFEEPLLWPYGLPRGVVVARRPNLGYDFGSWAVALNRFPQIFAATHVLLTNDSLVGPFAPLDRLLWRAENATGDVVFMTDSMMPVPHGQSFFVMFNGRTLKSEPVRKFFFSVENQKTKELVIEKYELPLASVCRSAGLACGVLFPSGKIGAGTDNPTLSAWRKLLFGGAPFLKRTVLVEPLFRQDSILMQRAVTRNFAQDVRGWMPVGAAQSLPSISEAGATDRTYSPPLVSVLSPAGDVNGVSGWRSEKVGFVEAQPRWDQTRLLQELDAQLRSGHRQLLLSAAFWVRLDEEDVGRARERLRAEGKEVPRLLVTAPRMVSRELPHAQIPDWASGVVQSATASTLWPEPPLVEAGMTLSESRGKVHFPRLSSGAVAQVRTSRSPIIPGVLRPGAGGPNLLGLELVDYSEEKFDRWLTEAAAVAVERLPERPEVFLFDYAAT